ncbi:MAG: hypothetical protein ACK5Y2_13105 [Bdellovibrionales bacterium]
MFAIFFFFVSLFCGGVSRAETKVLIWPYSPGLRLERGEDQQLEGRASWMSGVGFLAGDWYGALESERFEGRSSEGNVSITRQYQDLSAWAGYRIFGDQSWRVLALMGAGQYQEEVKTRVGALEDTSTSRRKGLFGAGFEGLLLPDNSWVAFALGLKMLWGEDFDPSPQPQINLKVGFHF